MSKIDSNHTHYCIYSIWGFLFEREIAPRTHRFIDVLNTLSKSQSDVLYVSYGCEGFHNIITNRWEGWLLDPFDNDADPSNPVVNGIEKFEIGNKFLAYSDDIDFSLHTDDSEILFPAVFYSRLEIFGWLALKIFRKKELKTSLQEAISSLELENAFTFALKSLRNKLTGQQLWSYGPARKFEPNKEDWYRLAGDETLNSSLIRTIDNILSGNA